MPARPTVSVVVPVLDEERALPRLLRALQGQVDEVLVVDGGSRDATVAVARAHGARVVGAPRGRGPQLRRGAEAAQSEVLCFLHADARPPAGLGDALRGAAGDPWGCFTVRLRHPDPRLRFTGWAMTVRARVTGSCTGDMGLWFRRDFYEALGGFSDLAAFEDLELTDRARRRVRPRVLEPALEVDPRRWLAAGIGRTVLRLWVLRVGWRLGVSGSRLAGLYPPHRDPAARAP